jgi:phosphatidylglycerophosphate synthase
MVEKAEEPTVAELFHQGKWFLLAFFGLMALFFILRPVFVEDLIQPFWDFFGLHNAWEGIMQLVGIAWQEFGLFLVFLVAVFLWWSITQKKYSLKKEEKK